jgi:hypothetical protein
MSGLGRKTRQATAVPSAKILKASVVRSRRNESPHATRIVQLHKSVNAARNLLAPPAIVSLEAILLKDSIRKANKAIKKTSCIVESLALVH